MNKNNLIGVAIIAGLTFSASSQASLLGNLGEPLNGSTSIANLLDNEGPLAGQPLRGRYIVTLDPNIVNRLGVVDLDQAIATLLAGVGGGEILYTYRHSLNGMAVTLTELQATLLQTLPGVLAIEQDQVVQLAASQANATWGLDRIDQLNLPLDGSYQYPDSAGNGVNVYILDTGLRASHNEFSGRVIAGRNFAQNSGGFLGLGGSTDPADTNDCNGHGSHVAGTAVGSVYGVAKLARVAPVRVLDCGGSGSNAGVIAGVDWVAGNHQKPAVANMSLGGGNSSALDDAVRNAVASGVTFVVAAGNNNSDACSGSPNRVAEALTVAATSNNDSRSSFSNFGSCVDIFAPGSNITAAWHQSDSQLNTISGTSMAAPHVAGAAALYLGKHSSATPAAVMDTLIADASNGVISNAGSGSANRLLYVDPSDNGNPVDRVPTAAFSVHCDQLSCQFDGSGSSDDVAVAAWDWQFGDGNTASGELVSHQYSNSGEFPVTLTVTDTANQTASHSETISVSQTGDEPACDNCSRYEGSLSQDQSRAHPSSGFSVSASTLYAVLSSNDNASFALQLQRRSCFLFSCSWSSVSNGTDNGSAIEIQQSVNSGTYRWVVSAQSGSGNYLLQANPR